MTTVTCTKCGARFQVVGSPMADGRHHGPASPGTSVPCLGTLIKVPSVAQETTK